MKFNSNNRALRFLILLLAFSFQISAQEVNLDSRLNGLEEDIEKLMNSYKAVGVAVSVVENGKTLYSKGFGYRDLEKKKQVDENTAFPIASCTKAFTATLLGNLEADGSISLQDKPSLYIPKLEFYTAEMNNYITIADLLSHKSGLGAINGTLVLFPEDDRLKVARKLKYIKPEGKVKESSIYSNMGYTLAGTIVEQATNKSWEANIQDKIFSPLQMSNSFTDLNVFLESDNYAHGYGLLSGEVQEVIYEEYHDYKPAGGIRSTVKDLSNWMLAWLNDGVFNDTQVIPADYIIKARKLHNTRAENYDITSFLHGYGLGWRVESNEGEFKVYHGGNTSGFSTLVLTYPFRNLGITVLSNQDDSILPYVIADIVKNRMLGKALLNTDDYPINVSEIYKPSQVITVLNKENPPTHALESFVGKYENKGYGAVSITLEDGVLFANYPTYKFQLEHRNHNIFVLKPLEEISDVFNPEFPINFNIGLNGEIESYSIELQTDPVVFVKI